MPYKHSNQSSIEALFSYVRGANRDRATSYGAAVSINNLVNSKNALSKNNKYYSTDDMADESNTVQVDRVFGRKKLAKENQFELLLFRRDSRKIPARNVKCPRFPKSALALLNGGKGDDVMQHLLVSLTRYQHYSELLLDDPSFSEIVKIAPGEPDVKSFSEMSENDEIAFDARCHKILTALVGCLQKSQQNKQRRTFYYYVLVYLGEESRSNFDYCLISRLARKLLEWLSESLAHLGQAQRKEIPKELASESANKEEGTNKEVNRYLGWAIHSLLERLYRNQLEDDDDDERKKRIIEFLVGMRIFHHNAINNQSYREKCYDDFDILRNKGWMTLISPAYFDFGIKLLTVIRSRCNQDKLKELGNSCIKIAKEAVLGSAICRS